ncbi:MAG: hypothetical protein KF878_35900 [Planctomycetes bacterium]|nr:hypothetical protein [Planctomycetota bacterium]
MRTAPLAFALLLLAGCAGPLYQGPPLAGTWKAADEELGALVLEVQQGAAGGVDCVLTDVDGQRLAFDATLKKDGDAGGFDVVLEVRERDLTVLFGPAGTDEVEGKVTFALGRVEAAFRRRKDQPFLDARFSRPGERRERTLKTIRLLEVPGGAPR